MDSDLDVEVMLLIELIGLLNKEIDVMQIVSGFSST